MIGTDKFIAGQLFINTVQNDINDDGVPFDVYLGEHMTIFHKAGNVWIHIPYNQRSNCNDNFTVITNNDKQRKSELRDFFWDKNNELIWLSNAILSKGEDNRSITLTQSKKEKHMVGLSNGDKQAYDDGRYIDKTAAFSITPSTKPSEIAKTLQAQLGEDFVKKEHITYIEQKELENPNEQTKLENQQKEIFCSPTIWCGFDLCSLNCFQQTKQQTNT